MVAYHDFVALSQSGDSEERGQAAHLAAMAYVGHVGPADEHAALYAFIGDRFWVGVNDMATEGMYVTVLGAPATFLPWASGEPDGTVYPEDDCIMAATSTRIVDLPCNNVGYKVSAICECEP